MLMLHMIYPKCFGGSNDNVMHLLQSRDLTNIQHKYVVKWQSKNASNQKLVRAQ